MSCSCTYLPIPLKCANSNKIITTFKHIKSVMVITAGKRLLKSNPKSISSQYVSYIDRVW